VTRSSGIMTLNSPGGSTLEYDRWLWDNMPLNSPKRPPYWNSTSGFDFDHHRSRHVIMHQSAKFYPNRTTLVGRKQLGYRKQIARQLRTQYVEGHSTPLETEPLDRSYTTYYQSSYLTLNIIVTLKCGSEVTQGH